MNKPILVAAFATTVFSGSAFAQAGSHAYALGDNIQSTQFASYSKKCHFERVKVLKWVNGKKVIVIELKKVCIFVRAHH